MDEPKYHLEGVVKSRAESLEDFDGPLDVILLLLSKNKIAIQDVSIASILDQYLAYLDEMKRMDMEIASEFIAMASHLMYIKSKMLLSEAEKQEAMSEMELLIRSLEERQRKDAYEQMKVAFSFLEQRSEIGVNLFTKQPEPYEVDRTYQYKHDKQDLVNAFRAIADRSERLMPPPIANFEGIVGAEPYPVTTKAAEVLKQLLMRGFSKFQRLFEGNRSRSEIVATFLAVLELCKLKSVSAEEDENGDFVITFLQMPKDQEVSDGTN